MNLVSDHHSNCFNVCNIHRRDASGKILPTSHSSLENDRLKAEDQQSKRKLDELLAQAMTGLTFKERQECQEIIHGVAEQKAEEASLIENSIQQLENHLPSVKEGTMYEVAEQMDPTYVHNRAFLIMFLRANEYNAEASADQMIRFFESKCQLFGRDKLTKNITMKDLNEDDIACLETGWIQHCGRDQSGRQVFVHFGGVKVDIMSMMRTQYFVLMRALESEETQLRGCVSVWYAVGDLKNTAEGEGYKEGVEAERAIPRKVAAIHICVDEVSQYVFLNLSIKFLEKAMRARLRVHFGSHVECRYYLTTFGVQASLLPVDAQGRVELTLHSNWLHSCAAEDNVSYGLVKVSTKRLEMTTAITPNQNDVLFGNGRTSQQAGNVQLRAIVKDYSKVYNSSKDKMKRQLAATVIDKVRASGGRFLKQTSSSWEEVPQEELRKKIMQYFRDRRQLDKSSRSKQKNVAMSNASSVFIQGEPLPNDVILGRNQKQTPGTELLNRLIKDYFEEYESLDRGEKMKLVEMLVQQIRDQGGRFLQTSASETGRWMELPDDHVRERISKYFRNLRRQSSKKKVK